MVGTAAAVGAVAGLTVQLLSNALRKHKLRRHPWEHLICMGVGAFAMHEMHSRTDQWYAETEEIIAKRTGGARPSS